MPRRTRPAIQPTLPLRPAAAVPVVPNVSQPTQGFRSLIEALSAAWDADDWAQIHTLMNALKDREDLQTVRYLPGGDHQLLGFALGYWYWQEQAAYWQAEAESSAQAIDTVVDRLEHLATYEMGEGAQREYMAWLREHGYPEVAPWDTDPAWFANPDVIGFVVDTLESTPYYHEKVQRYLADRKAADVDQTDTAA